MCWFTLNAFCVRWMLDEGNSPIQSQFWPCSVKWAKVFRHIDVVSTVNSISIEQKIVQICLQLSEYFIETKWMTWHSDKLLIMKVHHLGNAALNWFDVEWSRAMFLNPHFVARVVLVKKRFELYNGNANFILIMSVTAS